MSTTETKQFIERYIEALNGKDKTPEVVNQFVAETDQSLRQHIADAEAGFPRYELNVEDMIFEDDKAVVRFNMHATHKGDFMGIPATGKEINVPGIIIYRLADGKIVDHWLHFDGGAMMQQLGVQA
jgi:steroid delta-isomerase-like uncharacterized protein